ncbi:hypothetical protein LI056_14970 [Clostridium perfringens]|uniref:hypothetical protein n=1 Tax=Clostridium perfringens TaxID=1502 RepID=UPI00016BC883|nr:hypothetical protein [Clostridium perfringens]EDT78834.1 hypothetical protein AC7_0496 [Clostridium perfringens NCTC 8239]ELC8383142.1 hypothetical protein [Clostridium perfringens]MCX0359284.1 hypothetical protein [Clostridium perfringens]MCX0420467.1 hypothetical protein [Clostridium perfringens]MDK0589007.1 hypothetical protein [Clostridium perfringens]
MDDWKVYHGALLPNIAPHENANIEILKKEKLLKNKLFARYTSEFDCGYETNWWYLIKDDEIDLEKLNSKKRYEIKKGLKNCYVKKISSKRYAYDLYNVYIMATNSYKNSDKPIKKDIFIEECKKNDENKTIDYYGVFLNENNKLVGYSLNNIGVDYVNLTTIKLDPNYLTKGISFALVYNMLIEYLNVQKKRYINDGERSIRHVTNFQDYLIKYFGFRKAYCKLHIIYNPLFECLVKIIYPFSKILDKFDNNKFINNINSIVKLEKINREFI